MLFCKGEADLLLHSGHLALPLHNLGKGQGSADLLDLSSDDLAFYCAGHEDEILVDLGYAVAFIAHRLDAQLIGLSLLDDVLLNRCRCLSLAHRPMCTAGIALEGEDAVALDEMSIWKPALCADDILLEVGFYLAGDGGLAKLSLKDPPLSLDLSGCTHLLEKILHKVFRITIQSISYSPKVLKDGGLALIEYLRRRYHKPLLGLSVGGHLIHGPIQAR